MYFNVEDVNRLPGLEAQLTADLRKVMTDQMESEVVNGQGALISGLASLTADPDADSGCRSQTELISSS